MGCCAKALQNQIFADVLNQISHNIPPYTASKLQKLSAGALTADTSITPFDLAGYCYKASDILLQELEQNEAFMKATHGTLALVNSGVVPLDIPPGENPNIFRYHHYLSAFYKDTEIIIDPTIGQFLIGHNHIFIGTRKKLEETVKAYYQNGKLRGYGKTVDESIRLVWGEHGVPSPRIYYPKMLRRT